MKILNLKFKNINSLAGENEIDFTQPVFTNDGLFAITGKTGAGKSSILDAVSLALYGKTPRVDVTGTENAVMTRGEKDCFSEIVFEVGGKKWKSSWKQEVNRNGNLKSPNRVIADVDNKIVADQVRTCDAKIIDILGLTFEQFTKVIMLAQGSFTAFLQANKNEKGELLEQITGTDVYAEISRKVFERHSAEKEKLDRISVELEAIKILSEEEKERLKGEISQAKNDKKQVDGELQKIETAKRWLFDLGILQKQIDEINLTLPELEENAKTAKEALEKAEFTLKAVKETVAKQEPVFKQVREFDTKIAEKQKLLDPILRGISELEKKEKELSGIITSQKTDLESKEKQLARIKIWADENRKVEELVSDYVAIERENQLLMNSLAEVDLLNANVSDLKNEVERKTAVASTATEKFNEKAGLLRAKTTALENKKTELADILKGKDFSQIQSEKEKITTLGTQLKNLLEAETSTRSNKKEMDDWCNKISEFEERGAELTKTIEADKQIVIKFETQINLLDENIRLTRTIQSLDDHRRHLKDGEACPLCGSLEHPFALGNIPKIGEKEQQLGDLKKQFQETNKAIQQNEKEVAKLVSYKENALVNKKKEEKYLAENTAKRNEIIAEINSKGVDFSIPEGEEKIEELNNIIAQKREEFKEINGLLEQAIKCEKELSELRDREIPALQAEKQASEKSKNEAETNQRLAEQELKSQQEIARKALEKHEKEQEAFLKSLHKYDVDNMQSLKKRLDDWNENKAQTERLTGEITALKSEIGINGTELANKVSQIEEKQIDRQSLDLEIQTLTSGRKAIFAEKSVEEEENALRKQLETSEVEKSRASDASSKANVEVEKTKAVLVEKKNEFSTKKEQQITDKTLEELQTEFDEKKALSDEHSRTIGANNQQLLSDAENLKNSGSKLKDREKQQAVCNKWGALNKLIGSRDGKLYRNFAQALTFEHLIGLSNIQLQKMSDRYILKRSGDTSNPFDLSVIDKFQNSEERTAQNLSGGEKFVVSLSLALGLANMASRNMRIDTMFIDEGFGTLDSDYLDVALSALSNLQSEGKIIGIISHLSELKERIATHIEVVPSGNGHSKIQITF